MLYFDDIDKIQIPKNTVVTLGKFDGVHRGHQKLLANVHEIAKKDDLLTCAFTFNISPQARLSHKKYLSILDNSERMHVLESFGMDVLVECRFTDAVRNMDPYDFIKNVLIEKLKCRAVVTGTDFCFGKDRKGTPEFLKKTGESMGIEVRIIDKVMYEDREISSTYVKEELLKGNLPLVNNLLGFPFFAEGEIVHGESNGRTIGFNTANIVPSGHKMLPPNGVYYTDIHIKGQTYKGITNIGYRPTVDGKTLDIETHIPDFNGDIYGEPAKVDFYEFARPEKKFGSLDELKEQIKTDIENMKKRRT